LFILLVGLVGCTASHRAESVAVPPLSPALETYAQPASASALVFDPPVARNLPELNLAREGREPEAFWGYDSGTTTSYYLRTDDRQFDDSWNGVHRRAISERVGFSYR
jgi:hypothetical protein